MPKRPLRSPGTLVKIDGSWYVKLDAEHPTYAANTPVDLILWDRRPGGERSEVEEIARIQQLEPEVVALALSAEGALRSTDFEQRIVSALRP